MIQTMVDSAANNHAPVFVLAPPTLYARMDDAFTYTVPACTVADSDAADLLTYSVAILE